MLHEFRFRVSIVLALNSASLDLQVCDGISFVPERRSVSIGVIFLDFISFFFNNAYDFTGQVTRFSGPYFWNHPKSIHPEY